MRVLIETVGSAGDVHPFVAVGSALSRRGHDVVVFSNDHFRARIEGAGLRFGSTGSESNYAEITADPDLWHPTRGPVIVLGNTARHLLEPATEAMLAEDPGDDTVIVSPTLGFAGRCAGEIAAVPLVRVHLQPTAFRSVHRAPRLPGLWMPDGAPHWWKRLLYRASDAVIDRIVGPHLNAFRARHGLPPAHRVFGDWIHESHALLALYPEWFAPPQPDAPRRLRHTGFALFDDGARREPPPDLLAWLQAGSAPLLFTHGSANRHGEAFFQASAGAARTLGRRALLVTTEQEAVAGLLDEDVRHETYVPFGAVLPHAELFVHHGGIGTVAQGLAAGTPQLVVPMGFDQFDNAARVAALGAGGTLAARRYGVRTATTTIRELLDRLPLRENARLLAERVRADVAPNAAADEIEGALTRSLPPDVP